MQRFPVIICIACIGGLMLRPIGYPNARPAEERPFPVDTRIEQLKAERQKLDATVWKKEVIAQEYENIFIELWDDLRTRDDRYAVLAAFPFRQIILGEPVRRTAREWHIESIQFGGRNRVLTHDAWTTFLHRYARAGYRIVQSEWHHARFDLLPEQPARSSFNFEIHIAHPQHRERLILQGTLYVIWSDRKDAHGHPVPDTIDATHVRILRYRGAPAFVPWMVVDPAPNRMSGRVHSPILLYDLNGDGYSEIVLAGTNNVFWNRRGRQFERDAFLAYPPRSLLAGVIADFTGDGHPDFFGAGVQTYPMLYVGDAHGRFPDVPRILKVIDRPLQQPSHMTAGDIDGDGDLDVFIAQYKPAYVGGQMPTPYYDANDGYPSYLLRNDGNGRFTDITAAAGLAPKRYRRTYSASLVDLDEDGDLDLIVVSDYAGIDIYFNNGKGHFTDVTHSVVDEWHNFGMAHTFADFNRDGRLDFYIIGMSSTTARRLEYMRLGRPDFPDYQKMRMIMGYGNRMYLAAGNGRYVQPPFQDQVARSGWSWGTSSFDFDRDGDMDIYVANGHYSGKTAKDYCTYFWRHDIYTVSKQPSPAIARFFQEQLRALGVGDMSWNGFEHNHLFLNENGRRFLNVAFLLGVAFEFDSGSVVTDDLDLDGRPDLIVEEVITRREERRRIHVLRNVWPSPYHWIGVILQGTPGVSPIGATVRVRYPGGMHVYRFMTGDSYSAQHAMQKLFGLGTHDRVDWIEVRWPDGTVQRILRPAVDRYHRLVRKGKD